MYSELCKSETGSNSRFLRVIFVSYTSNNDNNNSSNNICSYLTFMQITNLTVLHVNSNQNVLLFSKVHKRVINYIYIGSLIYTIGNVVIFNCYLHGGHFIFALNE